MTVHNERCDCCGRKLQRQPSEMFPGEQLIGGHTLGVGRYCVPCYVSIAGVVWPGDGDDEVMPCPTHHPTFWSDYFTRWLAQCEIDRVNRSAER